MKLKDIINESYVVIDPRGNARPVGSKMQGAMYTKKMGGPKRGYHIVLAKNAMKARRAIEKNRGNATNSKIQDIMFKLLYEANQYRDVSDKFKDALERPDAAMAYAKDAFGWVNGGKWIK